MEKNLNGLDRAIRFGLAGVLFFFAWWASSWVIALVGVFVFYEALASWCVLYSLFGINRCALSKKSKEK
jgi:hypothetical protein